MGFDFKRVSHASILLLGFSALRSILGLALKSSIAGFFGAGDASDAYFAAFTIPQQIGDFVVGGVVFLVVIPVFQRRSAEDGRAAAVEDVSGMLNLAVAALLAFTLLYFISLPWLMAWLFSGFTPEKLELTVRLGRYLSPVIALMGMSLIHASLYHVHRDFATPALAALCFPVFSLLALWLLPTSWGISRLVWGNLAGSAAGLVVLVALIRKTIPWRLGDWRVWNPVSAKVVKLSLPVLAALVFGRAVPLVERHLAAAVDREGALSLLEFATFLVNSSFMLVLAPVSTAVFPVLSAQYAEGMHKTAADTFAVALKTILFLTTPLWLLFALAPESVVAAVFAYGRFSPADARTCGVLLLVLSFAVFPMSFSRLATHVFYVRHETMLISVVNAACVVLSLPLFFLFHARWGLIGVAAAFVATQVLLALASGFLLWMRVPSMADLSFNKAAKETALAALPAAMVFWGAANLPPPFGLPLAGLLATAGAGFATYFAAAYTLKMEELNFILEKIQHGIRKGGKTG